MARQSSRSFAKQATVAIVSAKSFGGDRGDVFRTRQSSLDAHLPLLDAQWAGGCRNGAKLWRRFNSRGFRGSQRVVSEWATRRRRAETASDQQLQKVPSARTIARLMTCLLYTSDAADEEDSVDLG